jgi:hypothetical protein
VLHITVASDERYQEPTFMSNLPRVRGSGLGDTVTARYAGAGRGVNDAIAAGLDWLDWRMASRPLATAVAGCAALAVAMGVGRFAFTSILPLMLEDVGLGVVEGGWLASAHYAGYLLGALSAAALPFGHVTMIRAGLAATGLFTIAMGLTGDFLAWAAMRLGAGIARSLTRCALAGPGPCSASRPPAPRSPSARSARAADTGGNGCWDSC